jgi:hypothetical protein
VLVASSPARGDGAEAAGRPYSVDDLLRVEEFGRVMFTPDGGRLLYERLGPFGEQPDFARGEAFRPQVYALDIGERSQPQRVLGGDGHGYRMLGFSPDGRWLVYRRAGADGERIGVRALTGRGQHEFRWPPEYFEEAVWLGDALIYPALPEGTVRYVYALRAERLDALVEKWQAARKGVESTASVLVSGPRAAAGTSGDFLAKADPDHGTVSVIAPGRFLALVAAPDGRTLAALRQRALELAMHERLAHGVNTGGVRHELVIYDAGPKDGGESSAQLLSPCEACDVLPGSMRWSPSGRYLAFAARLVPDAWDTVAYYRYDAVQERAERLPLGGLLPAATWDFGRDAPRLDAAWVGKRLLVHAETPTAEGETEGLVEPIRRRADWYLLGEEHPLNLTGEFPAHAPQLIAAGDFGVMFLHGGEVWHVAHDGRRTAIGLADGDRAGPWRGTGPGSGAPQSKSPVALVMQSDDAPPRLAFVDPWSGETREIAAPSTGARFVAADSQAGRVAVIEPRGQGKLLSVGSAQGHWRAAAELNAWLNDVAGGTPLRIDHEGADGSPRHAWLLLPPGASREHPLPTVVNVYPGRTGGTEYRHWTLDRASALNDHLLAARGYAVLYPSVPVAAGHGAREPLEGLLHEVLAAVDAAVATGYVDPARLAVQGQSHGGYAAAALVGLTDRFRAAVATAGIYNLVSFYGVFDPRSWLDVEERGVRMFGASWLETGVGRIGAPPWRDPERYLRNSPLMLVESVDTPILLIHGDRDFVSVTQAEECFTALKRLGKEAVFVRYFGEDHVPNSPANIRDLWQRILGWYEEHLGPAERPLRE